MPRICIFPQAGNVGGVRSFQSRVKAGFAKAGVETCHQLEEQPLDAVLLTSTSREVPALLRLKRKGVRIVQRLDGINWMHRRLNTGLRHFLKAEYGNHLLAMLRRRLTMRIVYQSEFVRGWWDWKYGPDPVPSTVIHNGVDLAAFSPQGPHERPQNRFRLLLVEGSLQGGYEGGLANALALAEALAATLPLELVVAGKVTAALQTRFQAGSSLPITWMGLVEEGQLPQLNRSSHLLFSADINPACPNSVIEALASGLPVAGFSTGALPELLDEQSGCLVPYGSDPWKLQVPDIASLARAVVPVLKENERFRTGARRKAEAAFGLEVMVQRYLDVLLG